jgi:hypothetical protein
MSGTLTAREFISSLDLSGIPIPRSAVFESAATEASAAFDSAKNQAQIVGSALLSFAKGVTPAVREAISDSSLLAQLVANKRHPAATAPMEWYAEYEQVLQNVGWVMQAGGWTDYSTDGTAVEVNEKIIEVLTAALGPSAAALTIIKSALDALQHMQPGGSWLTIFSRESQQAKIARFQIGLVENGEDADVFVTLLACLIEAQSDLTQVLFFKFRKESASFKANNEKVSINAPSLTDLGPAIRAKIRAYQTDFLSSIQDI